MSLREARKLLIKKLHARILELYNARPESSPEFLTKDEKELSLLFNHYHKLKDKDASEEEYLWKKKLQTTEFTPNSKQVIVTPTAYKKIMSETENPHIKSLIEKAVYFTTNNTFFKGEKPDSALQNPDSTGTGYLELRCGLGVKAIWEQGKPEKRIVVISSLRDEPCRGFFRPEKWHYLFKKCLPLNAI